MILELINIIDVHSEVLQKKKIHWIYSFQMMGHYSVEGYGYKCNI